MSSPRPAKRRCPSGYNTPTSPADDGINANSNSSGSPGVASVLDRAVDVLRKESQALSNVVNLYQTDSKARAGLAAAVQAIVQSQQQRGKLVICGVGKSGYIAMKLTATCKSLGISASFLHATEAVHGDLGDIRSGDVLLFISFSGSTPELLNVLPHVSDSVQVMAMSSHQRNEDCRLLTGRQNAILMPTPIPELEKISFGVSAPTTSTTVALAVADMLALTVSEELHQGKTNEVFQRNHPGGAIGMTHREAEMLKMSGEDMSVVELPSPSISAESED